MPQHQMGFLHTLLIMFSAGLLFVSYFTLVQTASVGQSSASESNAEFLDLSGKFARGCIVRREKKISYHIPPLL